MIQLEWFDRVTPRLLRREDGGWLAVTPKGSPLPIGVAAWTAEDARSAFAREVKAWEALFKDQPRTM